MSGVVDASPLIPKACRCTPPALPAGLATVPTNYTGTL